MSRSPSGLAANSWSERCLRLHAREGLIDEGKMCVDFDVYRPIGRLFGNLYAAQRDTFELTRESCAQRLACNGASGPSDGHQ